MPSIPRFTVREAKERLFRDNETTTAFFLWADWSSGILASTKSKLRDPGFWDEVRSRLVEVHVETARGVLKSDKYCLDDEFSFIVRCIVARRVGTEIVTERYAPHLASWKFRYELYAPEAPIGDASPSLASPRQRLYGDGLDEELYFKLCKKLGVAKRFAEAFVQWLLEDDNVAAGSSSTGCFKGGALTRFRARFKKPPSRDTVRLQAYLCRAALATALGNDLYAKALKEALATFSTPSAGLPLIERKNLVARLQEIDRGVLASTPARASAPPRPRGRPRREYKNPHPRRKDERGLGLEYS